MKVLLVGSGVIGTVYGAQLAAGGMDVSVLGHGQRTDEVARDGLVAVDAVDGATTKSPARVMATAAGEVQDLILVSVRREQLRSALEHLAEAHGNPTIVVFGNTPAGPEELRAWARADVRLGFPGIGGAMLGGAARYIRITEQPTALEAGTEPRLAALEDVLGRRGFPVQRVADMEGWLGYHAVLVGCVAAALIEQGIDPVRLGSNRTAISMMSRAISEGFAVLKRQGVRGLPGNLALLHHPLLHPIAVLYWARTMRSERGELYFGAHTRHAEAEMRAIGRDVLARAEAKPRTRSLRRLLEPLAVSGPGREGEPSAP